MCELIDIKCNVAWCGAYQACICGGADLLSSVTVVAAYLGIRNLDTGYQHFRDIF